MLLTKLITILPFCCVTLNHPIKSCESQKEYFGKKGMTLHIDVFYKLNDSIHKKFI